MDNNKLVVKNAKDSQIAFENANEVVVSNRGITSVISQVQAQRIAQSRCANYGKNAVYRGYVEYRYVFACTK